MQNNNLTLHNQNLSDNLYDISVKVIFVGDTNTGKTSTLEKIQKPSENTIYPERVSTIGIEFASIQKQFDDKLIKFQIWDTAGQEKYKSITTSFYKNCTIAILFCDVSSISSFNSLNYWLQDIRNHAPSEIIILLTANKCDLEYNRKVSYQQLEYFAKHNKIDFIEISAQTGMNIDNILSIPGKKIIEQLNNHINIPGVRINNFVEIKTPESICTHCNIM